VADGTAFCEKIAGALVMTSAAMISVCRIVLRPSRRVYRPASTFVVRRR
jgi:hypothetical protein